jgi:group II intron reverse transcriptase/maturase
MEPEEGKMKETSSSENVSTKLLRIAELAREMPEVALTTLAHHVDVEWLLEAYRRTRKDGATGVDGQTAEEYATRMEENLAQLLGGFKTGSYQAPPVRRVHIPKGDGSSTRPIGIPTFEDKVLQRAVTMVLEAIYEQEFKDCSYGFRPGRSAHQALEVFWKGLMDMGGGWVLEVDIKSFFDSVDHGHLRSFLDQRVRDGVIRRAIDKWLKAGVLEDGCITRSDEGTPQGGVLSPLLANVYLHEVLDKWFEKEVLPRMRGEAFLVRYADDAVLVFRSEEDARRVMDVLPKRFGKYGLTLHPEKTRLVDMRWPSGGNPPKGRSLELLGFTHHWGKSRRGTWVIKRRTASRRLTRALRVVGQWCRRFRHKSVVQQYRGLSRKLKGHYGYYGITGNVEALSSFRHQVERLWQKWLNRRGGRRTMSWERFAKLLKRYPLPPARIVHTIYGHAAKP